MAAHPDGWVNVPTPEGSDRELAPQPRRAPKFMRDMKRELEIVRQELIENRNGLLGHVSFLQLQNQQLHAAVVQVEYRMQTLEASLSSKADEVLTKERIQALQADVDTKADRDASTSMHMQALQDSLESKADETSIDDRLRLLKAAVDTSTSDRLRALQSMMESQALQSRAEVVSTCERVQSLQASLEEKTEEAAFNARIQILQARIDSKADEAALRADVASINGRILSLQATMDTKAEEVATKKRLLTLNIFVMTLKEFSVHQFEFLRRVHRDFWPHDRHDLFVFFNHFNQSMFFNRFNRFGESGHGQIKCDVCGSSIHGVPSRHGDLLLHFGCMYRCTQLMET